LLLLNANNLRKELLWDCKNKVYGLPAKIFIPYLY
jgi:hypothetical protein